MEGKNNNSPVGIPAHALLLSSESLNKSEEGKGNSRRHFLYLQLSYKNLILITKMKNTFSQKINFLMSSSQIVWI